MSNFLNNIVSHALGLPSAIQARLPSIYETKAAQQNSLELAEDRSAERMSEPASAETRVQTNSAEQPRQPQEPRFYKTPLRALEERRLLDDMPDQTRIEPAASIHIESMKEPQPSTHENAAGREQFPVRPSIDAATVHKPSDMAAQDDVSHEVFNMRDASRDVTASVVGRPVESHVDSRIQPPDLSSNHELRLPGEQTVMRESRPSIKITIGRVDVRAVMTPAPANPRVVSNRSQQTLTLQDYLKQREQGKR